jgi:uncharacterized protein YjbI with pentapeptide repeats
VDFSKARLNNAVINNCQLNGANMSGASLDGVTAVRTIMPAVVKTWAAPR